MKNDIINLLNLQQSKIIESTDKKVIVSAGPGSGKTYTIVKKIKKELSENDYSIIITSFTKEASNQLKNKLRNTCDLGDSYVGTLDSFVLVEIIDKFKNRYLSARGLKEVSKLKYSMPKRNSEIEELTRIGINPSTIKRIQLCLKKWLNDFSNGKYEISSLTYLIAIDLMNKCPVAKKYISAKYKTIYIDEAQDLNEYQHKFLKYLIDKCEISAVLIGDKNQSIYKFRGSRPELFYNLVNTDGFVEYKITVSIRCHPSILLFSNLIVDKKTEIIKINENHVKLNMPPVKKFLDKVNNTYFILFENNEDAQKCFEYCLKNDIKAIYTKRIEISDKDFSDNYLDIIEEIIRFRLNVNHKNPNLVYSIDDFKDYLSNYFLINFEIEKEIRKINLELDNYVIGVLSKLGVYIPRAMECEIRTILNNKIYIDHYLNRNGENRIMTIHSSKGLEADTVFVRISRRPFHVDEEYRRKLFVAFSRAKNNLYISYKDSTICGSELDSILNLNISIINSMINI